jgi:hypothetical protein
VDWDIASFIQKKG